MPNATDLIVLLVVGFVLLDAIIVFYIFWRKRNRKARFDHSFYQTQWQNLDNISQSSPAQALLEADKLFDHAMRDLGYAGTFVEKFQKAQSLVRDSQPIWNAHKLRNRIAHEAGFQIDARQIRSVLSAFRKGLSDFGVKF